MLLILCSVIVAVARIYFHGPPLARLVADLINRGIRGQVVVERIEWPLSSLPTFLTGGWIPVTVRGVKVYSDVNGGRGPIDGRAAAPGEDGGRALLLEAEIATGLIDAHALTFGTPDFVIEDLQLPRGGWVRIEEVEQASADGEDSSKLITLLGAFRGKQSPSLGAGMKVGTSPIFDLRDYSFEGVTVECSFHDFDLALEGMSGTGFLYADFSDPLTERLYYSLSPTGERGRLDVKIYLDGDGRPDLIYDVPLHDIRVRRLAQLPTDWPSSSLARDVRWDIETRGEDGAEIQTRGAMLGFFNSNSGGTYDLTVWAQGAGSIVRRFTEGLIGGQELDAEARITGPMYAPRIDVQATDVDVRVGLAKDAPPLEVRAPQASAWLDFATESGAVAETLAHGAGGELRASVQLALSPFWFDLALDIVEPIEIEPHLPRALAAELVELSGALGQPRLRGRFHITGDGKRMRYQELDLLLGRLQLTGAVVQDEAGIMHTRALHGGLGATRVTTRGTLNLVDGAVDVGMRLRSGDLRRWLRYFDAPPEVGKELAGTARIQGTIEEPRACAAVRVLGVPVVDELMSWLSYGSSLLAVDVNRPPERSSPCTRRSATEERTGALGGSLWASGRLRLGPRPRVLALEARGNGLDLSRIPLVGDILAGTMAVSAQASGPFDALDARARAAIDGLRVAGDSYRVTSQCTSQDGEQADAGSGSLCVQAHPDGSKELAFALARQGGGNLAVHARIDEDDALDGEIRLDTLPIDRLALLDYAGGLPIGGVVTAGLRLGGALAAPLLTGRVDWDKSWYDRAFLGPTGIRLSAPDPDTLRIESSLLQGDVRIVADVRNRPPYDAVIDLSLRRVELDRLAPELTAMLLPADLQEARARAWITGDVRIEMPLLAAAKEPPRVLARLSEAEVIVDYKDARGRPAPLRLRSERATPIAVRFDGRRAELLEPVTVVGPDGARFTVESGVVTLAPAGAEGGAIGELSVSIDGAVDMRLFEPYVRDYVTAVSGTVQLQASVSGALEAPKVTLELAIEDTVAVQPVGQEAMVSLSQGGRITITNDQIVFTGAEIRVTDAFSGQAAVLEILGGIRLEDFEPVEWTLHMDGQLAGQMLLLAAPEMFSRASGTAALSVSIRGPSDAPKVDANLAFDGEQPLALTLRGVGREIRLQAGEIELSDDLIELGDVAGEIGDNGRISRANGVVGLADWEVADVDVTLSADSMPLRVPQELELTVNVADLRVVGDVEGGLELDGIVEVVDGRYFRRFNLISDFLSLERGGESSAPFYEEIPLLAGAELDLLVDVRSFSVQNNLAAIHMSGDILVTGTLREPRFDGEIQVSDGEFKLPGARARFTRTWGAVTFSPSRRFPIQTPTVSLQSEGDYLDSSGQYHLITFTVSGSWSRAEWDLYTSSGLNKGQTFTLLFSGRTPAELRKSLGDEAPGLDPGRMDPAFSTSDNAADQILKDVAGDFISLLVEDTLRNITNLDVARIEIGTGSIGFHGEKKVTEKIRFSGDLEQSSSSRTIDLRGEVQLSDQVSVEGGARNQTYIDPAEEDVTDLRFRAVYRRYFLWPW